MKEVNAKNPILSGSIYKNVLLFALPIVATNMLQQLFNSADTAVVGRFADSSALAAVGSTHTMVALCITMVSDLAVGANVRVAHALGSGDHERLKRSIDTSLLIAVISGVLLTIIGEIVSMPMLRMLGTPEEILDEACLYLRIYFAGMLFLTIFNFVAAILRAGGDTKKPLYCLMISGVLNVGFNLLFVIGFGMGAAGVALATTICNVVNAVLSFAFLLKGSGPVRFEPASFVPERKASNAILAIGIPAAIQGMMFDLANLIVQAGINSLGADVIAATTVSGNAETMLYYLFVGFGQASVTFTGQNYGAGNLERCRKSVWASLALGSAITLSVAALMVAFARPFSEIFTTNQVIVDIAVHRLILLVSFYVFDMVIEVFSGALRGYGYSVLPMAISALMICGTRIIWMFAVFPHHRTYFMLNLVYPVSWILDAACVFAAYLYMMRRTPKQKVKIR